jgi:hypothetical protein
MRKINKKRLLIGVGLLTAGVIVLTIGVAIGSSAAIVTTAVALTA